MRSKLRKNVKFSRQRELKSMSHLQTLEVSRSVLVEQKTHCSPWWEELT